MKMLLLWLTLFFTWHTADTSVLVKLVDEQRQPIETPAEVHLHLYRVAEHGKLFPAWEGTCTTVQGVCRIAVPDDAPRDQAGFLRGYVEVRGFDGHRSVMWPAGKQLTVGIMVSNGRLYVPSCGPYDNQKPSPPISSKRRAGPLFFLVVILPLLLGVYAWYRRKAL